ncbi:MAG TPA: RNA polymerase sigma factor [Polyangia bacterium]|nr:RNA polymerase sigma factor [Polyangia bacterium]
MNETDEALMSRYQHGDVRAFELLLARHRKPVFNFILRFVGNRERAEDLLQETFLRVIKGGCSYQREARFTTWLYTIARNQCIDLSRRMKLRQTASLDAPSHCADADGPTLMESVADADAAVDRRAADAELQGRLKTAIERLGDEQREVFLMRELLHLQFKEIAAITGVPENTVKSRMRYALEKLRDQLEDYRELARVAP